MKEQFLYVLKLRNYYTGNRYVKVGYSADVETRIMQLIRNNKHFEFLNIQLYQHKEKKLGYLYDEKKLHEKHKKHRAGIHKDSMPDGSTECYDSFYSSEITTDLGKMGYQCVFDSEMMAQIPEPMFTW
ncbi:hypothetical protein GKQ23_13115 [Erwinia sp. E602]|uniref:hypothetical protein n=1 Tax=Erwinia sp. E602 TaxID=2675378 RepID=UPI001BAA35C1|nr:hypothetical protein [Erwinia sp. E602]QUG75874.1 hypothetical protein GKQ23_13115 [Erwinia sp. E602]